METRPRNYPKCRVNYCLNRGVWYPILKLDAPGVDFPDLPLTDVAVCDVCKPHLTVKDFVNDRMWGKTIGVLTRLGKVDAPGFQFKREWVRLDWGKRQD